MTLLRYLVIFLVSGTLFAVGWGILMGFFSGWAEITTPAAIVGALFGLLMAALTWWRVRKSGTP